MLPPSLRAAALAWRDEDPDATTRLELEVLLSAAERDPAALRDLEERFSGELEFGTAGLRGVVGAGPRRMNRAVVRRSCAGLAAWLVQEVEGALKRGVAIGYDARPQSRAFAHEAAELLCAAGFKVHLFDAPCPTPLLAFSILELGTAAGIAVTASHNPPAYNGLKVYWENGVQIIPPHDRGIAEAIAAAPGAARIPVLPLSVAHDAGLLQWVGRALIERYLEAIAAVPLHPDLPRELSIVYTPLHGVGGALATEALRRAGFEALHLVREQYEPDGSFPTLSSPNPEEPAALALGLALMRETRAELLLANDPDADRLCVACRHGEEVVVLTGDELGLLLGSYLLEEAQREVGAAPLYISTIVSSTLLGRVARSLGAEHRTTLTGFKWIANKAIEVARESGCKMAFGYEEAIGYCVGFAVRDKDGLSAALLAADMAAWCRARGRDLMQRLEELSRRYGLCRTGQRSLSLPGVEGAEEIARIMRRLRDTPPAELDGAPLRRSVDLAAPSAARPEGELRSLPESDLLLFEFEKGTRVIARPSGTEPKIKFYFELFETVSPDERFSVARARADERMEQLASSFLAAATSPRS